MALWRHVSKWGGAAALLAAACGTTSGPAEPTEAVLEAEAAPLRTSRQAPRDWLGDLTDDGSLIAGLSSADAQIRIVAARNLARLPSDSAGTALANRAAREPDPRVLAEIAFALGQWGDTMAVSALLPLTLHEEARVRAATADAMGRTFDDRLTPTVVALLDDPDPDVRGTAALALARLDGRRYDHLRQAAEEDLSLRDDRLAALALRDPDPGVRWRATYAIAALPGRGGFPTVLRECLGDPSEPLRRVFAVRGLRGLAQEGHGSMEGLMVLVNDPDERVAIEAARWHADDGRARGLAILARDHPSSHVRREMAEALPGRLAPDAPDRAEIKSILWEVAQGDDSPAVCRAARVALVRALDDRPAFEQLVNSDDPRDRAAAGTLLAEAAVRDNEMLDRLLADPVPAVRVAALGTLGDTRFSADSGRLRLALASADPGVLAGAAEAAGQHVARGEADPQLLLAVADALQAATGYQMTEARQALEDALGLPRGTGPVEVIEPPEGRLLDRALLRDEDARADPAPRVRFDTDKGPFEVELLRTQAPIHVASFLELTDDGFYDGLDFHRVVPNFVVQGLDPRGDGMGTAGRRVPDEFNPVPYVTGTLGMPHAGTPHSGGCQIFITHLPTPHLDGNYTVFGQVVDGLDVIGHLEVGDVIRTVRRVDDPQTQGLNRPSSEDDQR